MQITISQYSFSILSPYSAGMPIDEAEAQALNALRGENIREGLRKKFDRLMGRYPSGALSPEGYDELRRMAAEADQNYQFKAKKGEAVGEVNKVIRDLAREQVEGLTRAKGLSLTQDEFDQQVGELSERGDLLAEAQRRMRIKKEVAEEVIAEVEGVAEELGANAELDF